MYTHPCAHRTHTSIPTPASSQTQRRTDTDTSAYLLPEVREYNATGTLRTSEEVSFSFWGSHRSSLIFA